MSAIRLTVRNVRTDGPEDYNRSVPAAPFRLSDHPGIARRQISTLAKQGRQVTSKSLKPGATVRHAPAPITPVERRSHPNRPGGPRLTIDSKPRSFAQSMLLLGKMMQS